MQVINLLSAPATYPAIDGDQPNGMIFNFIRVNLYISNAGIFWQWLRASDNQWGAEIALNPGYYSLDRDAAGIQVRSQSASDKATVTIELLEAQDIPDVFLNETNRHSYAPDFTGGY